MSKDRDAVRQALIDSILMVAPEADFAELRPDRPVRDQLDIDSFDFLTILEHLHEKLGVNVPELDYAKMATLEGSVDYLTSRLAAGAGKSPASGG
jgi:acyl carrier protein